eukprot:TRINITY_DN3465_c0_g1_i1.p1 TRINITY_DN3465_c0_g1~~TRINITY_DN3465_c0_g1_i1.p1  ORF type:complete len:254 (+),score=54.52 TRINITY_DN3465_c0_g1_i1:173-934(+)
MLVHVFKKGHDVRDILKKACADMFEQDLYTDSPSLWDCVGTICKYVIADCGVGDSFASTLFGSILSKIAPPDRAEQVLPLAKGMSGQPLRISAHLALTASSDTLGDVDELLASWSDCEPCLKITSIASSKDLAKMNEECGNAAGSPALKHVVGGLLSAEWLAAVSSKKELDFKNWEKGDNAELKKILGHYVSLNPTTDDIQQGAQEAKEFLRIAGVHGVKETALPLAKSFLQLFKKLPEVKDDTPITRILNDI